jgi:acyl-CoA reductase-like NAD-dependent aldehyde dehydrogenase
VKDEKILGMSGPTPSGEVASLDPATGEAWRRYPTTPNDDVDAAIERARSVQPEWRARSVLERSRILGRLHDVLFARREDVARTIARENGKPVAEAMVAEVLTALDIVRYYARLAPAYLEPRTTSSATLALWRKRIRLQREPLGVVAVISPWNYPFMLPAGIVVPALVAGNAVILKPSELTPTSAELLRDVVLAAGVPNDAFQVIQGDGGTGRALVDGRVDKVFFTGSVATGRRVAIACASRLVPCVLELGGSDAAIVLEDADVEHAASGIAWGRFSNAGQTCVAPKRVFVVGAAYDGFVEATRRRLAALRLGVDRDGGADVGPMIRPSQRAALAAQRDDASGLGARRITGDNGNGASLGPAFFPPTLLLDLPPDARVLREETFGPLLPIVRVDNADDAIRLANASDFGLSASVWSRNRRRAMAVASQLEAGTVAINDVALVAGIPEVPHGGVKSSGMGRSHGTAGLEECVRSRTIVDDILPRWRQPWWFGYSPSLLSRMDAYARLAHGRSIRERLSGVAGTLKLLFRPDRPV